MTAAQVDAFFQDYAGAFSRRDVDRICQLWDYPAFMSYEGRQAALDRDAFRTNTEALCAFYDRQGLARAEKQVLELARLTATTASVRTEDRLYDAAGRLIAQWEHVYLLSETADGLRAAAALPDNELAAWRARGTPLGSRA
jgi:hypothetical protein